MTDTLNEANASKKEQDPSTVYVADEHGRRVGSPKPAPKGKVLPGFDPAEFSTANQVVAPHTATPKPPRASRPDYHPGADTVYSAAFGKTTLPIELRQHEEDHSFTVTYTPEQARGRLERGEDVKSFNVPSAPLITKGKHKGTRDPVGWNNSIKGGYIPRHLVREMAHGVKGFSSTPQPSLDDLSISELKDLHTVSTAWEKTSSDPAIKKEDHAQHFDDLIHNTYFNKVAGNPDWARKTNSFRLVIPSLGKAPELEAAINRKTAEEKDKLQTNKGEVAAVQPKLKVPSLEDAGKTAATVTSELDKSKSLAAQMHAFTQHHILSGVREFAAQKNRPTEPEALGKHISGFVEKYLEHPDRTPFAGTLGPKLHQAIGFHIDKKPKKVKANESLDEAKRIFTPTDAYREINRIVGKTGKLPSSFTGEHLKTFEKMAGRVTDPAARAYFENNVATKYQEPTKPEPVRARASKSLGAGAEKRFGPSSYLDKIVSYDDKKDMIKFNTPEDLPATSTPVRQAAQVLSKLYTPGLSVPKMSKETGELVSTSKTGGIEGRKAHLTLLADERAHLQTTAGKPTAGELEKLKTNSKYSSALKKGEDTTELVHSTLASDRVASKLRGAEPAPNAGVVGLPVSKVLLAGSARLAHQIMSSGFSSGIDMKAYTASLHGEIAADRIASVREKNPTLLPFHAKELVEPAFFGGSKRIPMNPEPKTPEEKKPIQTDVFYGEHASGRIKRDVEKFTQHLFGTAVKHGYRPVYPAAAGEEEVDLLSKHASVSSFNDESLAKSNPELSKTLSDTTSFFGKKYMSGFLSGVPEAEHGKRIVQELGSLSDRTTAATAKATSSPRKERVAHLFEISRLKSADTILRGHLAGITPIPKINKKG